MYISLAPNIISGEIDSIDFLVAKPTTPFIDGYEVNDTKE